MAVGSQLLADDVVARLEQRVAEISRLQLSLERSERFLHAERKTREKLGEKLDAEGKNAQRLGRFLDAERKTREKLAEMLDAERDASTWLAREAAKAGRERDTRLAAERELERVQKTVNALAFHVERLSMLVHAAGPHSRRRRRWWPGAIG